MTVRDALFLEMQGLPFCVRLLRYTLIYDVNQCKHYGGGAYLRGLAYNTEENDMETGATVVLENEEFIERNLKQHPHEHLQGSLLYAVHGAEVVRRELGEYLYSLPSKQQQSIVSGSHQSMSCSSYSPDLSFPEHALTVILKGIILQQTNAKDVPRSGGRPPIWSDAFGLKHPISAAKAKEENQSIYDATLFDDKAREAAIIVILFYINYITMFGGWLYMDTNEEALKVRGCISMVNFILGLHKGTNHAKWTIEKEFSFGDVILTMDMDDGLLRKIVVHGPECWQGYSGPDLDRQVQTSSMWRRSMSNFLRYRLTGVLRTQHDTLADAIGVENCFLDEPVMGNILIGCLHFLWLIKNAHAPLMVASSAQKNLLTTTTNLFEEKYHDMSNGGGCLMSRHSKLFGHDQREKDKRD